MKQSTGQLSPILIGLLSATLISTSASAQNDSTAVNKAIIRAGFEAWASGTGSFFDLLTRDVHWQITGSTGLSKTYTDKQSFMDEVIVPLNKRLSKKIVPTVRALFAEKDWVIALWDGQATAADGKSYDMSYAWFMQLKDGKIVNVVAFLDGMLFDDVMKRIEVK